MGKENYYKYYRCIPVPCGGLTVSPLCVLLKDWDEFIILATKYLRLNNDLLRKRLKLDESHTLFAYVTQYVAYEAKTEGNDEFEGLQRLARMFSFCYRLPVEPMFLRKNGVIHPVFRINNNDEDLITSENYEEIREMIMEQNLIFEPLIAPNEASQKAIDMAIAKLSKNKTGIEINWESIFALLTRTRNINDETYTYYQMRADYSMELRLEQSRAIPTYRAVGADVKHIELGEVLDIHDNPYSFDKVFKRNDRGNDKQINGAKG